MFVEFYDFKYSTLDQDLFKTSESFKNTLVPVNAGEVMTHCWRGGDSLLDRW